MAKVQHNNAKGKKKKSVILQEKKNAWKSRVLQRGKEKRAGTMSMTNLLNVIHEHEDESSLITKSSDLATRNETYTRKNSSSSSRSAKSKSKMLQMEKQRLISVYSFKPYRQRPLAAITEHLKNIQATNK